MTAKHSWWFFVGLYGLTLTDNNWTPEQMLFSDSTIAPTNLFLQANEETDEAARAATLAMLGMRPWREILDMSSVKFGNLIQQPPPDAFIAIRRNRKPNKENEIAESALNRAREIAAMLTIARSHGSFAIDGFMDVSSLERTPTIGIIPYPRLDNATGQFSSQHRIYCARWLREPDRFSLAELSSSLEQGTSLQTIDGRVWSIYVADHFITVMKTFKRTAAQQRLVRAALHLYDAHHCATPEQRLTQAVTSLEMLFSGTTNFSLLTRRLSALLPIDTQNHEKIELVMKLRHGYVHNGDRIEQSAGDLTLGLAAMAMYCFAEAISYFPTIEVFEDRLDLISSIQQSTSLSQTERQSLLNNVGSVAPITKTRWLELRSSEVR
ncbi:hypothetical protein [Dendronalium sp. ChiSLP03b]|uniref:hypothetical protein n=1 Tax=Dendronalium sp. ChiSLP03b TaxID=3075381 RepID=UPI002AD56E74|nr:hypothetical protein [Dendronalium sp. ChiSLP03b]MDZ8206898.1 hypothetical protein [Dendronalium sp. ChiSLP03b]